MTRDRTKYNAEYYQRNKEAILEKQRIRHHQNKDEINAKKRAYYHNNIDTIKPTKLNNWKKWYKLHGTSEKRQASNAKRRAAKIHRTPSWLDATDWWTIEQFYKEAKRKTETYLEPWHVDHIVPLQGDNVSGLHVPWNLRVIRGSENLKKHNKYIEEV